MRVFVTGASGWIGTAATNELLSRGHEVVGLARSDASAAALTTRGITSLAGALADLDVLERGAKDADTVLHLGFVHDFDHFAESGRIERAAVQTFGDTLAGSGRALLLASGLAGLTAGRTATEDEPNHAHGPDSPRGGSENLALEYAAKDVRVVPLRFAASVHGTGDHGFAATLVRIARERGVAGYVGDGANRWPAVHRSDAARLVALAVEGAPAGATVVHAVGEGGVPMREIAAAIGRGLGVPTASIDPDDAAAHFGWMSRFAALDAPASSALTQARFGWEPTGPTLLEDLASGSYFA